MTEIIVCAEDREHPGAPVLLRETVDTEELASGREADQLVARLGWALAEAEEAERRGRERQRRHAQATLKI